MNGANGIKAGSDVCDDEEILNNVIEETWETLSRARIWYSPIYMHPQLCSRHWPCTPYPVSYTAALLWRGI